MADQFKEEVEDLEREHWAHQSYHSNCSACFKEHQTRIKNRISMRSEIDKLYENETNAKRAERLEYAYNSNPLG